MERIRSYVGRYSTSPPVYLSYLSLSRPCEKFVQEKIRRKSWLSLHAQIHRYNKALFDWQLRFFLTFMKMIIFLAGRRDRWYRWHLIGGRPFNEQRNQTNKLGIRYRVTSCPPEELRMTSRDLTLDNWIFQHLEHRISNYGLTVRSLCNVEVTVAVLGRGECCYVS